MEIKTLAETKSAIKKLSQWYFEEWGFLREGTTLEKTEEDLYQYLNENKIPLIVVATDGDEVLGSAKLRLYEMDIYPNYEHWLGAVYVSKTHRGNNIASAVISKICKLAVKFGAKRIYLQTQRLDGGLYNNLGWVPVEQTSYRGLEVLVMVKELNAQQD